MQGNAYRNEGRDQRLFGVFPKNHPNLVLELSLTYLPRDLWHLGHWIQFWQLRTWIHNNLCYLARVTLDSIHNSCDWHGWVWQILFPRQVGLCGSAMLSHNSIPDNSSSLPSAPYLKSSGMTTNHHQPFKNAIFEGQVVEIFWLPHDWVGATIVPPGQPSWWATRQSRLWQGGQSIQDQIEDPGDDDGAALTIVGAPRPNQLPLGHSHVCTQSPNHLALTLPPDSLWSHPHFQGDANIPCSFSWGTRKKRYFLQGHQHFQLFPGYFRGLSSKAFPWECNCASMSEWV